ncbi:uncharacterized protein Dwil_GK17481 [Drosophila willistoni]|uniref:Uncharacterized protein n=1 Tax=Drosophila willistoni TaxID=7260 RepID=B4MMH1_DROWI|nr:uncharacterized protein LOC6639230 [Drosophila willistoni]EDW73316.2 uncharacterized protein Dwil_GK17481 [Drosophila willistoni]
MAVKTNGIELFQSLSMLFDQQFSGYLFAISLAICAISLVDCRSLNRRDVSHLPLEYLPPVVLPPLPSRDYLPPVEQHASSLSHVLQPPRDYLPPVNNEYLPPVEENEELELPTTTTEAEIEETTEEVIPTTTVAAVTEPQTEAQPEAEPEVEVKTHEDVVEDEQPKEEVESAVLQADGYHYRTPEVVPDLLPTKEYLPPLDHNNVVAEEVPNSKEASAALQDDGYHYRSIKRLRF